MNKKNVIRALAILIAIVVTASVVSWFLLPYWSGIFVLLCGGIIVLNILISIFFVNKNFKK